MYLSFDKRIQFAIIFLPLKDSHSIPDMGFFIMPSLVLSQLELSSIELAKLTPYILIKNCDHSICPG